jgi:signal peptidase I
MMLGWRLHRARVRVTAALAWAIGSFVFALLAAAVVPLAFGLHTYAVRSGSMTPTIDTGDLVITRSIPPTEARTGDIVIFRDPEGSGRLISHRVRAIREHQGRSYFVTRGDANNAFERWSVLDSGSIGQVVYRLPKLGYALGRVSSGPGKIGLVVIPALILLVLGLIRIWRPQRPGDKPAGAKA